VCLAVRLPTAPRIFAIAAVLLGVVLWLKFDTIHPCGILRAQIRQDAVREGGFGDRITALRPPRRAFIDC
jgi:hypothetical protein